MSGIIAHWSFNNSLESTINSADIFTDNTPVYIEDNNATPPPEPQPEQIEILKYENNNWTFIGDFQFKGASNYPSEHHYQVGKHKILATETVGAANEKTASEWGSQIPTDSFGIWMIYIPWSDPYADISRNPYYTPIISRIAINLEADDPFWNTGDTIETPSDKTNTTYRITYPPNLDPGKLILLSENSNINLVFDNELHSNIYNEQI